MKARWTALIVAIVVVAPAGAFAQAADGPAARPQPAPDAEADAKADDNAAPVGDADAAAGGAEAPAEPLVVTVKSVTGPAERMTAGADEGWVQLKAGDKLGELTLIRTGFGARVELAFADNSTAVVRRATKMGISQFRKQAQVTRTQVGLKYGSVRADIDKARGPSDFRVRTAVATAAAQGTGGLAKFDETGMGMTSTESNWLVTNATGGLDLAAGEHTNGRLTRSIELARARRDNRMVSFFGLTPGERWLLLNHGGGRGGFDFFSNASDQINANTPANGSSGENGKGSHGDY